MLAFSKKNTKVLSKNHIVIDLLKINFSTCIANDLKNFYGNIDQNFIHVGIEPLIPCVVNHAVNLAKAQSCVANIILLDKLNIVKKSGIS